MPRANVLFLTIVILAAVELIASGCGGSPRQLQSVSVSPATADAQSFPGGQVQFTAVGTYSQPPSPSNLAQAGWSLSDGNIASISQNGLAQCTAGESGVVSVMASVSGPCSGTNCTAVQIVGTAKLTCP